MGEAKYIYFTCLNGQFFNGFPRHLPTANFNRQLLYLAAWRCDLASLASFSYEDMPVLFNGRFLVLIEVDVPGPGLPTIRGAEEGLHQDGTTGFRRRDISPGLVLAV